MSDPTASASATVGLGRHGENLSIMIPTYNCADYLRHTLQSLREQGPSIRKARIVVMDDCSTRDDPQAVVKELWPSRVRFIRHANNIGVVANFNGCIHEARRRWIHILHGDDIALPGAYEEFAGTVRQNPQAIAVFGRSVFMEIHGFWKGTTPILGPEPRGGYGYRAEQWSTCPVQCAGVLISQPGVEAVGEFDSQFCHAADWNMWWRLARTGRVAYTNRCVGGYRMFEGNHSSTLRRNGLNMRESVAQAKLIFAECSTQTEARKFWAPMLSQVVRQCQSFRDDPEALARNVAVLDEFPDGSVPWRIRAQLHRMGDRQMAAAA